MLTYEAFVSLIFRWIDFAILTAGAGYIFWHYGKPFLSKIREDQQVAWQGIEHEIAQSTARTHLLEQALQQDRVLINELERKVKRWKDIVEQKEFAIQQQSKRIADHIAQEHAYKAQQIKQIILHKLAIDQAFDRAEYTLKEKFSHKQAGTAFVKTIIQRLQESQ